MANKRRFQLFGALQKVEPQDDGTLIVEGIASSETVDGAGEVVKADAMRQAIPAYMEAPAVREMHQPIAAGKGLTLKVDDAGVTHFRAHIVDTGTVQKILEDVLRGFSIGGRVTSRDPLDKTIITGIKLTEISVVDVPCNPDAKFSLGKLQDEEDDVNKLEELKKWLGEEVWDARRALEALATVMDLLWSETQENHPEPPEQVQALKDAAQRLKEFIASEVMEDNDPNKPAEVVALAAQVADLQKALAEKDEALAKAGAKFSKATRESLDALHKVAMDCHKAMGAAMDDLGKAWAPKEGEEDDEKDKEEEAEKAARAEALQKSADDLQKAQADLAKVQAEAAELRKNLETANADLKTTKDALAKAQSDLKAKGVAKVVEKGSDGGPITSSAPKGPEAQTPADPLEAMKSAQAQPIGVIYHGPRA